MDYKIFYLSKNLIIMAYSYYISKVTSRALYRVWLVTVTVAMDTETPDTYILP
jgi:hypothetical protein